jgi:methyl-accepting chemotaxis protein
MLKENSGTGSYMFEGSQRIVGFCKVENSNWIVIVGVQKKKYYQDY